VFHAISLVSDIGAQAEYLDRTGIAIGTTTANPLEVGGDFKLRRNTIAVVNFSDLLGAGWGEGEIGNAVTVDVAAAAKCPIGAARLQPAGANTDGVRPAAPIAAVDFAADGECLFEGQFTFDQLAVATKQIDPVADALVDGNADAGMFAGGHAIQFG
jgi:hypothetical protein